MLNIGMIVGSRLMQWVCYCAHYKSSSRFWFQVIHMKDEFTTLLDEFTTLTYYIHLYHAPFAFKSDTNIDKLVLNFIKLHMFMSRYWISQQSFIYLASNNKNHFFLLKNGLIILLSQPKGWKSITLLHYNGNKKVKSMVHVSIIQTNFSIMFCSI